MEPAALSLLSMFRLPSGPVSLWVIAGGARDVETAYPAIDAALTRRPGHRLLITVPASDLAELRRRLPHETVVAQPGRFGLRRWLWRLRPILTIRLGASAARIDAPKTRELVVLDPATLSPDAILSALPETVPARPPRVSPFSEALVRLVAGAPIADLDALKRRLGAPATILCLGNGPSSEDPVLKQVTADRLFRVNWIWRARGLLAEPDLVFTADPDMPPARCRPIVAFPRRADGMPILARHALRLRPPRGHLFLADLPEFTAELAAEPIPTNGALMIAVAAALRPRRLVIAGIDLYAHPAGRYPGDGNALDGYSRQHGRDRDLTLIRASLAAYDGEVEIIGDALSQALERG